MVGVLVVPFVLQAVAMFVDERVCHRRRGLPRWERLGHPLDTLTVLACYAWLLASHPSRAHAGLYAGLAAFSCLFITKDEPLHAARCSGAEQWVHAVLFILHPVVLIAAGYLWWTGRLRALIVAELVLSAAFATYQLAYWSRPWRARTAT